MDGIEHVKRLASTSQRPDVSALLLASGPGTLAFRAGRSLGAAGSMTLAQAFPTLTFVAGLLAGIFLVADAIVAGIAVASPKLCLMRN